MKRTASKKLTAHVPPKPRTPFVCTSAKECFEHFEPLARAAAPEDPEPCRLDVELVRANVNRGVEAIRPPLAAVQQKLPEHDTADLLELHELALALLFAAGKVVKAAGRGEYTVRFDGMGADADELVAVKRLRPRQ